MRKFTAEQAGIAATLAIVLVAAVAGQTKPAPAYFQFDKHAQPLPQQASLVTGPAAASLDVQTVPHLELEIKRAMVRYAIQQAQ